MRLIRYIKVLSAKNSRYIVLKTGRSGQAQCGESIRRPINVPSNNYVDRKVINIARASSIDLLPFDGRTVYVPACTH